MKYILFLVVGYLFWRYWQNKRKRSSEIQVGEVLPSQPMVACCVCGIYSPANESLEKAGHFYCSELHRDSGAPRD